MPSFTLEDFVFNWAYPKIIRNTDTQQFGNIESVSTFPCLISLLDFILSHLDKHNTALAFVDFKNAFDIVDHTVLFNKGIETGFNPNLTA